MKTIIRVTSGDTASGSSPRPIELSADGNYVFYADTIPPTGSIANQQDNEFLLFDAQTGAPQTVITVASSETFFFQTALSENGQFVAYSGTSSQPNGTVTTAISVFDRATGATHTVFSETDDPLTTGAPTIRDVAISPDGQSVFFTSDFPDMNGSNSTISNGVFDLFQLDVQTGSVQRVLVGLPEGGIQASSNGNLLAYAGDNITGISLYRVDETTGNLTAIDPGVDESHLHQIGLSQDGRFAVITTDQALLPQDTNGVDDIYLKDLTTGDLRLISASATGAVGSGASLEGQISADGSKIAFVTEASNLSSGASSGTPQIVIEDVATGRVGFVAPGDNFILSADGDTVALETSQQLIAADTDNVPDLYQVHLTAPKLGINPVTGDNLVSVADGLTITISGTSDAIGQLVTVTLPALNLLDTAIVKSDGTWSTSIDARSLPDGAYDVHAVVTDALTTTTDDSITVDRSPPQLTFTSVASDDIINLAESTHAIIAGSVLVADPTGPGTVQGTVSISIDGGPAQPFLTSGANPALTADDFSKAFDASGISDGQHTITLTATDEAGNTTSVTKNVLIDTTPPKIAVASVSGDDVVDSTEIKTMQGVHGTSDAIGHTVDVLLDGVEAGQAVVQADGTWLTTVNFAGTTTGGHDITAEVEDEAGNPGRADAAVYVDAGFSVQQLSDGPDGEQGGGQGVLFPSLSADGTKLVFTGLNFDLMSNATGSSGAQVYIKDLTTGAITFVTPDPSANAEFGTISPDGRYVEFVTDANLDPSSVPGLYFTYTRDLTTGINYLHHSADDRYDGTDPDTFNPGITAAYYSLGNYPDGTPIQSLPVFPLAIADGGSSLDLVDDLEPDQVAQPLVMTTLIRLGQEYFDADGTPYYYSGGVLAPNASPPIENDYGRYITQMYAPQLSADGSVAAFESRFFSEQWDTSTYPPPVTVGPGTVPEIYAGSTSGDGSLALASCYADGTPMPLGAIDPALSADGKFVAFWSWGADGAPEVFVKNLASGELKIASSDVLGNPGVNNASGAFNAGFNSIAISADGRYVAFTSDANLTPDDSGTGADLFVKDMQTGAIERVPLPSGTFASDLSSQLAMRADGQYIVFTTAAGLSAMDVNHVADVYGLSLAALGTPPQIAIDAVAGDDRINAAEVSKNLTVAGTSNAIGGTVTLVIDGNTLANVVVGADGTWSTDIDATQLIDGVHQFRATVTNTSGSTGSVGDLVTVDRTPPTIQLAMDKAHLSQGQTATVTVTFSEDIGNLASNFLTASGGTLSQIQFVNDHTLTATFTDSLNVFSITAHAHAAFDFAGNSNLVASSLVGGKGFDGYLSGSTVFADASGNGVYDAGEASTTTDASGNFTLSGAAGPLILTGGTDIATGLAFTGKLEAPEGAAVVTPLTTVVEALVESGDSATQANDLVTAALGLPAGIDLTTLDAVAGALSGDPAATAVFKAGSELLDVVSLIRAAGGSADAAYAALAADITAASTAGTTVDLADVATIEGLARSAGLDATAAQVVASIASETEAALERQIAGLSSPLQVFVDITGASIAEQGDAASALAGASGDAGLQQVANSYLQNLAATLNSDDATAAGNVACYCPGTSIATVRGDVAVERLVIGDLVVTASGLLRPIKWVGTRNYGGRFIVGRKDLLPIRITAGAIEEGVPRRDLWISPHHAMYLDGLLIEAKDLVNDVSIVQSEAVEKVEYFHIELDSHDVILAEGAWSETFVDDDSRGMFHNAQDYFALYPDAGRPPAQYCAPRLADGFEVEAVRRRIAERAGLPGHLHSAGIGVLRGFVDEVSGGRIAGWAQDCGRPEVPVCLDIIVAGRLVGQTLANIHRADLQEAGMGSGCHSFVFVLPAGTPVGDVEVRRSSDQVPLTSSHAAMAAARGPTSSDWIVICRAGRAAIAPMGRKPAAGLVVGVRQPAPYRGTC